MTEQDKIVVLQDNHRLRAENDTLRRERDEARRMYCGADNCTADEAMLLAKEQGWDCYKEKTP